MTCYNLIMDIFMELGSQMLIKLGHYVIDRLSWNIAWLLEEI